MALTFSKAELTKFDILANGLAVSAQARAFIDRRNHDRPITSADYASTSGVIVRLDSDIWVNAPTISHNSNFIVAPVSTLDIDGSGLVVTNSFGRIPAAVWAQPAYNDGLSSSGQPYSSYGVTHTDRVRVSPIEGCAFTCTFCDLPYEFRYRSKDVAGLVETARAALDDPDQPAAHILISGGTPRPADYSYVRDCYEAILTAFPDTPVDIMMVPLVEVLDLPHLKSLGLAEVSINLEVWSNDVARRVMPRKHKQGRDHYLGFLEHAADVLGGQHVRSMLMLGLEPVESTLEGVEAIAERGCVPVLSPFRADPATPLRGWPVPTANELMDAYSRAWEITTKHGVALGPPCQPCAHNTLTLTASDGHGSADRHFGRPRLIGTSVRS